MKDQKFFLTSYNVCIGYHTIKDLRWLYTTGNHIKSVVGDRGLVFKRLFFGSA